ncbi:MAG: 3-deoxy-manno-octulosonate cytidylyltransferase [Vicinamibacteria bacterium]|nr:3-deoxy-manno-octulosonate cytidylyltransferase [Vicinamibacteria bacterium]
MSTVAIIPARFASTRLPGKPLRDLHGRPMIHWVWLRARAARLVDEVLVATDDARIADAVHGFGGRAVMTSPDCASGSDRLAEVVRGLDAEIVVNVQGDEPLLDPAAIDRAIAPLREDPGVEMATLSAPLARVEDFLAPQVVKVVVDARGDALYFSRSPIPFVRDDGADAVAAAQRAVARGLARKHVGLYVYRRATLLRLAALPRAPLEDAEGLEQLRALHHGIRLRVVPLAADTGVGVDTAEDLERAREALGRELASTSATKGNH